MVNFFSVFLPKVSLALKALLEFVSGLIIIGKAAESLKNAFA